MTQKWRDIRRETTDPAARQHGLEVREAIRSALALADLRKQAGLTQTVVGERMGVGQEQVSRVERRADVHLSTLREYVEALGGRLELAAVFPDGNRVEIGQAVEERTASAV
jgi:transcriptional regulator with XRE-family HTH domain